MTIMISCERGNRSGWAFCGGIDIPEGAIFVRCNPNEPFTYDLSSTDTEVTESRRRPEIAFVLTGSGEVQGAIISRSSGSRSLDAKALAIVTNTRYKATGCGSCRVVAKVAVDLKKRYP
jgi:TonB family protein